MSYRIKLENFEGPLDLLLYFIRRDELDIYDIPISKITKDYVAVIEEWKKLNMVIAGDFIVMASTLMRVKAKMMIPRPELDEDGDIIDPREELMKQLIDYRRFRDAADMLDEMADRSNNFIEVRENIKINDFARVFKEAIENRPKISQFELNREPIKLEKQKEFIFKHFDGEGRLRFKTLIKKLASRMEIIVTFLAVLDLVKEGICRLDQQNIFGEIELVHLIIEA